MPAATIQPAIGLAMSSPVANSTPSCWRAPPTICSSAPGMAQSARLRAVSPEMPALMAATYAALMGAVWWLAKNSL